MGSAIPSQSGTTRSFSTCYRLDVVGLAFADSLDGSGYRLPFSAYFSSRISLRVIPSRIHRRLQAATRLLNRSPGVAATPKCTKDEYKTNNELGRRVIRDRSSIYPYNSCYPPAGYDVNMENRKTQTGTAGRNVSSLKLRYPIYSDFTFAFNLSHLIIIEPRSPQGSSRTMIAAAPGRSNHPKWVGSHGMDGERWMSSQELRIRAAERRFKGVSP